MPHKASADASRISVKRNVSGGNSGVDIRPGIFDAFLIENDKRDRFFSLFRLAQFRRKRSGSEHDEPIAGAREIALFPPMTGG